jgi:transcriptional regulator with XRE-family HTH domain
MREPNDTAEVAAKVRRLVEERGWNQEEFARIARLNRHTARQILGSGPARKLRNATINACARALGLTVNELRSHPVERLLVRMSDGAAGPEEVLRRKYAEMTQPELKMWVERNPDRARQLTPDELDELIERRRKLVKQLHVLAGTEYLDLLEQLVALLYEKVRPPENTPP